MSGLRFLPKQQCTTLETLGLSVVLLSQWSDIVGPQLLTAWPIRDLMPPGAVVDAHNFLSADSGEPISALKMRQLSIHTGISSISLQAQLGSRSSLLSDLPPEPSEWPFWNWIARQALQSEVYQSLDKSEISDSWESEPGRSHQAFVDRSCRISWLVLEHHNVHIVSFVFSCWKTEQQYCLSFVGDGQHQLLDAFHLHIDWLVNPLRFLMMQVDQLNNVFYDTFDVMLNRWMDMVITRMGQRIITSVPRPITESSMDMPKTLFNEDYQHIYGLYFICRAIKSHYQTRFSTVVLGGNPSLVSLMTRTLALFMDEKSLKKSTLASRSHRYNPYLKLQGILTQNHHRTISIHYLLPNYLILQSPEPTTIVHLDSSLVYQTKTMQNDYNLTVNAYTDCDDWMKYLGYPVTAEEKQREPHLSVVDEVPESIKNFVKATFSLPGSMRASMIQHFKRQTEQRQMTLYRYIAPKKVNAVHHPAPPETGSTTTTRSSSPTIMNHTNPSAHSVAHFFSPSVETSKPVHRLTFSSILPKTIDETRLERAHHFFRSIQHILFGPPRKTPKQKAGFVRRKRDAAAREKLPTETPISGRPGVFIIRASDSPHAHPPPSNVGLSLPNLVLPNSTNSIGAGSKTWLKAFSHQTLSSTKRTSQNPLGISIDGSSASSTALSSVQHSPTLRTKSPSLVQHVDAVNNMEIEKVMKGLSIDADIDLISCASENLIPEFQTSWRAAIYSAIIDH